MAQSAEVSAGDDILASQYNNLRKDVLDASLGHEHKGGTDGNKIPLAGLEQEVLDKLTPKLIQQGTVAVTFSSILSGEFSGSNTAAITSVDTAKAYIIFLGFTVTGWTTDQPEVKARVDLTNATTVTANAAISKSIPTARTIIVTIQFVVVEWG